MLHSTRFALFMLVLVCAIWGVGFVVTEHALGKLSTQSLNALRFALAALSLLPLWYWSGNRRAFAEHGKMLLGASAGLGFVLFLAFYTQTEGLRHTSVSNAGFITGMLVPLVPLLNWLLFRQRIGKHVLIAVALSSLGLWLLTGGASALNKGDLLVLAGAVGYATHIVLTGHYARKLPVLALAMLQMVAVSVYSLIASAIFDADRSQTVFVLSVEHWANLLTPDIIGAFIWMAVLSTAFGFWVQTHCQQMLEAHKVALVFALEPIFAHIAGAIWLGERLTLAGWLGAGAIIGAMLLAELGDRKANAKLHPGDLAVAPDPGD